MFFPFLAATAIGVALMKLGALSVQVTVLVIALKVFIAAVVAGLLFLLISSNSKT